MEDKLSSLSEEKKKAIVNAALEVFGTCEYKRASTDLIAAKAGISKGLLFYYFKNKKELYMYLFEYVFEKVGSRLLDSHFFEITDFFELLAYTTEKKARILSDFPYLMEYSVRAFFTSGEDVSEEMNSFMKNQIANMFEDYFKNVDMTKFREDAEPREILHMLLWLTDGYMHQRMFCTDTVDADLLMQQFRKWSEMLKRIAYKEEYLTEMVGRRQEI